MLVKDYLFSEGFLQLERARFVAEKRFVYLQQLRKNPANFLQANVCFGLSKITDFFVIYKWYFELKFN